MHSNHKHTYLSSANPVTFSYQNRSKYIHIYSKDKIIGTFSKTLENVTPKF